ncbi:MAG: trypsin-like peptidase domain-containing protein [Rhodospirillales bacterium]|nr:trypsin-like peptidase domain-containing protein [Rhodospirillales bacterium]
MIGLTRVLLLCALVYPVVAMPVARAAPFDPDVLNSVVSLLPDWPSARTGTDARLAAPKDPEGTAVAIFPGGYLATNAHVLGPATQANIRLNDGRLVPVEIIGTDGATDLALIKAPMEFPLLTLAPEPALGSSVCAVGNQFGLGLSVTCGVVSATRRTGTGFNPIEDFLQTDAVINPGGSGGPLVDEHGRMVGLVAAIFTKERDSNIGVNFATSSALVLRILEDLRDYGKVVRVKSGLQVRALTEEQRRSASGARIIKVTTNTAGDFAGLQAEDILTRIGSRVIRKPSDVPSAFQLLRPGVAVSIRFLRAGQLMETTLYP